MNLIVDRIGPITVVAFPGPSLDASNNREFVETFSLLLAQDASIVFDMSQLRFVDSSGLGSMMVCMRHVKASGGTLKLCGLSKSVQALFELVRMNRVFEIYQTREEAIQSLQSSQE
jgi:anti-sigma B factor antagonist